MPAVYSVLVEDIVTAPPSSVIVTFDPSLKARVSPSAKVFPPAVTDRTVSVSVTVVDITLLPSIDIPVPAVYSVLVSVEDITPSVMSMFVPALSLSVKSLYDPELATVESSKTFLAATASNAVITPTIGAVDEPVPPLAIGKIPSTSSDKSILLTFISLLFIDK